tara:strand:- start:11398 stop:15672 length:4275 start_codon:yes stop_codon:yes gene_type:complete
MSKKRSRRNTKSFKKSRARAGIPRQDLRSGGRVGFDQGGTHETIETDSGIIWVGPNGHVHNKKPSGQDDGGGDGGTKPPIEAPPLYDETEVKAAKELGQQRTTGEALAFPTFGQDPSKLVKDTGVDPSTITQKEDIEEIAASDYISAEDAKASTYRTRKGKAETAVGVGRPFTPEEMQENWKTSDEYQVAVEKHTPEAVGRIEDKLKKLKEDYDKNKSRLGRSGLANYAKNKAKLKKQLEKYQDRADEALQKSFEEWSKSAPKTTKAVDAITYDAAKADDLAATVGATGTVSKEPTAASADVTATTAAQRDTEQEEAAKATAVERPGKKLSPEEQKEKFLKSAEFKKGENVISPTVMSQSSDGQWWPNPAQRDAYEEWLNKQPEITSEYAEGVTTDETYEIADDISEPTVTTRTGRDISPEVITRLTNLAQERGVALEDLPEYKNQIATRTEQTGEAATRIDPVTGLPIAQDMGDAAAQITDQATAEYYAADYQPQGGNTDIDDTPAFQKAATRVEQVQEAAKRIAKQLGEAPSLDLEGREAILGEPPVGTAAEIGGIPTFAAAQMEAVKGRERMAGAAVMNEVVADLPEEITAAISEDPAKVTAQLDTDPDPKVIAAVAALPEEALVSTQMSNLLAGMEEGKTPLWARPAVAAVEQMMASRGLSASSVGRDALFNAIIQSALPMAQSNAQALQQRAQQNLSNEQQANLASAQNTMQVRMQNLANRQTAASQTASMAQQIKVQQGQFNQQAKILSGEQLQQTEMANFQAAQQRASQESSQRQQAAIATLSANAQMDLANLKAESLRAAKDMDAESAGRLAKYNADINKIMRQADFEQDMEKANISAELQIEAIDLNNLNLAARDRMTAEQQERLTNFQTLVDFKKTNVQLAQQMELANLSNDQQMRYAELQDKIATDSANFTADNQFELAELTAKIQRSVRQAELDQRMEEVNLDAKLKVELSELSEKNATSRANMTAEQQTDLANLNTLVDFRKTNAQFAQQMDLANLANEQQIELAELQDRISTDAANFTEENRFRFQELNTHVQVMSMNEELKQRADLAKLSMQEKIELANLDSKNRADSESMSAENVTQLQMFEKRMRAGEVNAQLAQQMGLANLSNEQSAAMFNAQVNANLDMTQFNFEQQTELANSKFLQTMTATDLNNRQQTIMQDAASLAAMDMQAADLKTQASIQNARNFLQMDMANLNNAQQGIILDQQLRQQRILSDQASENSSRQFNATSANQVNQFNANMAQQMQQFNVTQLNAMEQFNVAEKNRARAINAQNETDVSKFNAQMETAAREFNSKLDFQREQWNAANAQAVEQSNVEWRRKANTIDTAAQNTVNAQNAQNSFAMSTAAQAQMWQEIRDQSNRDFTRELTRNERIVALINSGLASESFMTNVEFKFKRTKLFKLMEEITGVTL